MTLPVAAMHQVDGIQSIILQGLQTVLSIKLEEIDGSHSFITLGGDSLAAIRLATYCTERQLPVLVRDIMLSSRLDQIARPVWKDAPSEQDRLDQLSGSAMKTPMINGHYLTENLAQCNLAPTTRPESIQADTDAVNLLQETAFTKMQLSLIHENENSPRTNIIRFCETYLSTALSSVRRAWKIVMDQEAIFQPPGLHARSEHLHGEWTEVSVNSKKDYEAELAKTRLVQTRLSCFKVVTLERERRIDSISTVVWCVHHAYIDGYSAHLLHQKMIEVANGRTISPGPSFWAVASEMKLLQKAREQPTRDYWAALYDIFGSAAWEIDFPSSRELEGPVQEESTLTFRFPYERIVDCSASICVTPAAYYCSAWGLALSKLMNNDRVSFGMVFSGRDLPIANIQHTIGPCINTLPLFVSTAKPATMNASTYIRNVFQTLGEHSNFQLLHPEDSVERQYSSVIAFQYDMSSKNWDSSYTVRPIDHPSFTMESDIPVSVLIFEHGVVQIRFNKYRYNTNNMQILGELFSNAMEALLYPESSLLVCFDQLISTTERIDLLHTSNCDTLSTFNKSPEGDNDIVTLFERIARRYSESVAVVRGTQTLTYGDFDAAADCVAQSLTHIQPGEAVCVMADRSINWLVAALGILKARGVYVPLDPNVPSGVRNENFKRCGARTCIATTENTVSTSPPDALECFVVEHILRAENQPQPHPRRAYPIPDDAAYICFTSGSTGNPKAVQCTHRSLVAFLAAKEIRLYAEPGMWIAQTMSPVFDGSILEIFSALCYGATICLPEEIADHPFEHVKNCDVALFTPSVGKVLKPQDYPKLKHVYMVGEALPQAVCDVWSKDKDLYNMYGPTESTCGVTLKWLPFGEPVSIGYPNPSSRIYVLDRNQQLMPAGTVGEIYTAGVQVSKGYLGQAHETHQKFSMDSVLLDANERMYQTGDMGYWDITTKELHCKGRMDRQIKLRGFRLDLQNLEARIARVIPECTDVVVYCRDDNLIAVLRPASLEVRSVRSRILQELPGYAAPRRIIAVDAFPLTVAGKLDYKSLESIRPNVMEELKSVSLEGTEKIIAHVWRQLLNLGPETEISPHTDFIALGGHSLLQIRLANALTRKFNRYISTKTIIENPFIQSLSIAIDAITDLSGKHVRAMGGPRLGRHDISPIERYWLHKYNAQFGTSAFNVSRVYELDATTVDYESLCSSWDRVLARHKILRSRFINHAGGIRVYQSNPPRTDFVRGLNVRELINHEFDPEEEYPVRVTVSPRYLVICISHIVCDVTTLHSLLDEFSTFYSGSSPIMHLKEYEDTCWSSGVDYTTKNFWRDYLPEPKKVVTLATKRTRNTFRGTSYACKYASSARKTLHSIIDTYNLTHHQAALAVVSLTLESVLSSNVVFGSPFMGRSEDDEGTIGLFLQPLPICIPKTTVDTPLTQFLGSIRVSSQSAVANALPWNAILDCLINWPTSSSSSTHPLLDVMVTFHDERVNKSRHLGLKGFEELVTWSEGSKFPLMFEFTLTESFLILRIEYSNELFTEEEIKTLVDITELVLQGLEVYYSVGEVVKSAKQGRDAHGGSEVELGSKRSSM